ncbi:MAG: hypothetical protein KGK01_12525 [Bradyrhizobium sp.]|nr:hypothetical protein [Bradyrhizobium sp.]
MQLITKTISAAIVILAVAAAPALARTSEVARSGSEIAPTPCHAYEQNPDGSWKELSCAENGLRPAPAPARISTRNEGKTAR